MKSGWLCGSPFLWFILTTVLWCRLGRVWLAQGYPVRFLKSGALNMSSSSHAGSRLTWCVSCSLGCQIGGSFVGRAVLVITLIFLIPEIHLSSQVRPRLSKHSLSFWSGTYWGLHAENARLLALIPEMPTQIFLPLAVLQAALFLCLGASGLCRAKRALLSFLIVTVGGSLI